MSQSQPVLAVVIPAFRAEAKINQVISQVPSIVDHIVIVDDCSPDQTTSIVEVLKPQMPAFTVAT